jgi:hypothetical protein
MKNLTIFLAMAVATILLATQLRAEPLVGDNFISVMQGNTLSGTSQMGVKYNIYFLPGGDVSYQDASGRVDKGNWTIDPDGDVCIKWKAPSNLAHDCYKVDIDGTKVSWKGKTGAGHAGLRGEVAPMDMAKSQ